jgi:hypothetical protein
MSLNRSTLTVLTTAIVCLRATPWLGRSASSLDAAPVQVSIVTPSVDVPTPSVDVPTTPFSAAIQAEAASA